MSPVFVGPLQRAESGGEADAEERVTASGSVESSLSARRIKLDLANRGAKPIRLSYVIDQYAVKTSSGRSVLLEKDAFFEYPSALQPDDTKTVSLVLPKEIPPEEIQELVAKLNDGRTTLVLTAFTPPRASAAPGGRPAPIVPTSFALKTVSAAEAGRHARLERFQDPPEPPVEGRPEVPAPVAVEPVPPAKAAGAPGYLADGSVIPAGTQVPAMPSGARATAAEPPATGETGIPRGGPPQDMGLVMVEYRQDFGSSLRVDVRWEEMDEPVTLVNGTRQPFYLSPGRHTLYLACRMPIISKTVGHVPVTVKLGKRLRIGITAHPRLSGADLKVRVWDHHGRLVFERMFGPDAYK